MALLRSARDGAASKHSYRRFRLRPEGLRRLQCQELPEALPAQEDFLDGSILERDSQALGFLAAQQTSTEA